ncbi:hypothetical protein [Bacteroides mediterraneensis]|nr:hypothetical protein [Bacteroides mediterraneensis]
MLTDHSFGSDIRTQRISLFRTVVFTLHYGWFQCLDISVNLPPHTGAAH